MKVFITYIPQQPPGSLRKSKYHPQGNERLEFGETRFPIIPVMNGYAEPGETIRIIAVYPNYKHCHSNMEFFREEVRELFERNGYVSGAVSGGQFDTLDMVYDDAVSNHIDVFSALTNEIHEGDVIHACITYGTKPSTTTELMALRYVRQFVKNTHVACVVYGQYDWDAGYCKIYDETALVYLDDILRVLAQSGTANPGAVLKSIIEM